MHAVYTCIKLACGALLARKVELETDRDKDGEFANAWPNDSEVHFGGVDRPNDSDLAPLPGPLTSVKSVLQYD